MSQKSGFTESTIDIVATIKTDMAAGKYQPLGTSVGRYVCRKLGWRFHQSETVSSLICLSLGVLVMVVIGLGLPWIGIGKPKHPSVMVAFILSGAYIVAAQWATQAYVSHIFQTMNTDILDAVRDTHDLLDLENWLKNAFAARRQLAYGLIFALTISAYFLMLNQALVSTLGIDLLLINFSFTVLWGSTLYLNLSYLVFTVRRLNGYSFHLFLLDPSRSKIIYILSDTYTYGLFLMVLFSVLLNLMLFAYRDMIALPNFAVSTLLIWVSTIVIYLANQFSLRRIIQNSKLKTMDNIQTEIERLCASQDGLRSKEDLEKIDVLLNLHDRVERTRSTAFNLQGLLNILVTLFIPLFSVLIANLDKIRTLFP